jgi:hypothetical protein
LRNFAGTTIAPRFPTLADCIASIQMTECLIV